MLRADSGALLPTCMAHFSKLRLFGIPNCTTVKKARAWLTDRALDVDFHDYKKLGVDAAWLAGVAAQTGWEPLLNTRGTTWRKLEDADKAAVVDQDSAIRLMQKQPSVIKRPILEKDGQYHVGFSEDHYQALFGA